jgi:hypothetical protein
MPISPTTMSAITHNLAQAKEAAAIAVRIRAEGGDSSWHEDQANCYRRQAYVLRLQALYDKCACTRCLTVGHTRLGDQECHAPVGQVPNVLEWLHECAACTHVFIIERHADQIIDGKRMLVCGTGKHMVYKGDMNREYAMCPKCTTVEHQFSAEGRDQAPDGFDQG